MADFLKQDWAYLKYTCLRFANNSHFKWKQMDVSIFCRTGGNSALRFIKTSNTTGCSSLDFYLCLVAFPFPINLSTASRVCVGVWLIGGKLASFTICFQLEKYTRTHASWWYILGHTQQTIMWLCCSYCRWACYVTGLQSLN